MKIALEENKLFVNSKRNKDFNAEEIEKIPTKTGSESSILSSTMQTCHLFEMGRVFCKTKLLLFSIKIKLNPPIKFLSKYYFTQKCFTNFEPRDESFRRERNCSFSMTAAKTAQYLEESSSVMGHIILSKMQTRKFLLYLNHKTPSK